MIKVHGAKDSAGLDFLKTVEGCRGAQRKLMGGDNEFLADLEGSVFGEGVGLADGLHGDFGFIGFAISLGDGAEGIALGHDMLVAVAFGRFGDGERFLRWLFSFPLFPLRN
jgi:hypothetical protein